MNRDSLDRSLEAIQVFYDRKFAPVFSARELAEPEVEQFYRTLQAIELHLCAIEAEFGHKAGFKPGQPRVPAGNPDGGRWTVVGGADVEAISRRRDWARPETLIGHHIDHGRDFSAKSPEDYARKAQEFGKRAQVEKLPTVMDRNGILRSYDAKTNSFGTYNPTGTTRSFYKPKDGIKYFEREVLRVVSQGGKVVNSLPRSGGGGVGIRGGTIGRVDDIFHPIQIGPLKE